MSERSQNTGRKKAAMIALFAAISVGLAASSFLVAKQIYGGADRTPVDATSSESSSESVNGDPSGDAGPDTNEYDVLAYPKQDVVGVVKSVSKSVVSINVTSTDHAPGVPGIPGMPGVPVIKKASGSGIIISEDNEKIYIVTNHHVIQNADSATVSIDDETNAAAHHVGSDTQSDLAVISVTKTELAEAGIADYSVAAIGNSDSLEVGEYVVAIGNALGEGKTVTDGIVSAKNKTIDVENAELTVLQTNAAINQGNSGGPLCNMSGEVIGINTAKLSTSGVEGMGYSIPIKQAKEAVDRILQDKDTVVVNPEAKPQLGLSGVTVTNDMIAEYGFRSQGVYVAEIVAGGSAEKAGLQNEDVIIGFESKRITTMEELTAEMNACSFGDTVKVYVYRGDSLPMLINVTISGAEGGGLF